MNYIDNLRWGTVSLLIAYHAAMAYNTWNEKNYIFFCGSKLLSAVVVLISPWFMPLMFLLAGVSARFSLQKRGYGEFIRERFLRLGIPLLFGCTVISPVLSYFADVTHNAYSGGYLAHYGIFFTRFTDLTGYDGGFTMGHLWFIAVLIIVSLISCLIIKLSGELNSGSRKLVGVILSVTAIAAFGFKPAGKPLVTYLCVYLLGYYFFSDGDFTRKIGKHLPAYALVFALSTVGNITLFLFVGGHEVLNNICDHAAFASGILTLMTLGQKRFDCANAFTRYFSKISYVFYILHFPLVVGCQYLLRGLPSGVNFLLTLLITYPLTYGFCVLAEKSGYVRILFGLKPIKDNIDIHYGLN